MKKVIGRTCMGCNQKKDKRELLRVVVNKQGEILVDDTGKMEGRGAYICYNIECLNKVIKSKRLERVLENRIDDNIYESLRGVIIDKEEQNKKD